MTINAVSILRKNGSLMNVGTINSITRATSVTLDNRVPNSVRSVTAAILNRIAGNGGIGEKGFGGEINVQNIKASIIGVMRNRTCTVFLVSQTSSRGQRYIAYAYHKIKHSGQSLCTYLSYDDIVKAFVQALGREELARAQAELERKLTANSERLYANINAKFGI